MAIKRAGWLVGWFVSFKDTIMSQFEARKTPKLRKKTFKLIICGTNLAQR